MANEVSRRRIARLVYEGRDGHIPSAFSIIDLLQVLYGGFLRVDPAQPESTDRDYFVLSKGHGCVALYVTLAEHGFLTEDDLLGFCRQGGILGEHPDVNKVPGVEASTGSLGHGLPFALGIALGLRIQGKSNRVVVLVGDGECNEGTVWESAMVAAARQFGNLVCIVDGNGSAEQILPVQPLAEKWRAFGWDTQEIDGHDPEAIRGALDGLTFTDTGQPKVIVARTVKGKGVTMVEGHGVWHHRIPSDTEYAQILEALA